MDYLDSIRRVEIAEALYNQACDRGDLLDTVLAGFFDAKSQHVAKFGRLRKVNGQWT